MNDFGKSLGGIITILVVIIIGVLVYYSIATTGEIDRVTDTFTATNTTNMTSTLTYTPLSDAEMNVTYYNSSAATWHTVPSTNWSRSGNTITFTVLNSTGVSTYDANLSQVRYRYYTDTGAAVRDNVNPQAATVFALAPIVAIVVMASIILAVVTGFGGGKQGM